jgi:hypothetical protein
MYQESFAAISAIGCHMYLEDCSVLMQPVKVKYIEVNQGKNKKVSHKEIQI